MGNNINLDLFLEASIQVMPTLQQRVDRVIETLAGLFREGKVAGLAFSGGKDSATCAALTLLAARKVAAEGLQPLVVVSTSDTLIENPEVNLHYKQELAKMYRYGKAHGFEVYTQIVTPSLASTFQIKVLTGRGMPSFAGQNTDCSIDLKQKPQIAWRNAFLKSMQDKGLGEPVTILGTRYDESEKRRLSMLSRNETDREPVRNKTGDLVLSPIAWWQEDEVWEFLGEAAAGSFGPVYSDFEETRRIYAHSSGTSCAVVADAISSGKPARGGCGARHGCFLCQQSVDKSLENLLEYDERYAYMAGLNKLNKFIRATRWDWSRRHWIGRTIKAGYIAIEPDTYHPTMIRELARYMLQLDYDEERRAWRAGEPPRFRILTDKMIMTLDALWSLNGLAQPFAIWKDWRDIRAGDVRYDIPDMPITLQTEMPAAKFIYVGEDWDESASCGTWTGLRDPMLESLAESCFTDFRELEDGRVVWDIDHNQAFNIHDESLFMIMDFEMDRMIEMAEQPRIIGGITAGYKWYASYGALQLSHSQVAKHDEILRRTAFKDRMGWTLEYDIGELLSQAVDFRDLPDHAREEWNKKATSDTSQVFMQFAA